MRREGVEVAWAGAESKVGGGSPSSVKGSAEEGQSRADFLSENPLDILCQVSVFVLFVSFTFVFTYHFPISSQSTEIITKPIISLFLSTYT